MKGLILLLVIGFASASYHEMLDGAIDDYVLSFLEGMEKTPSLRQHVDFDDLHADEVEDQVKTELGKRLKETVQKILDRIKTAVEEGKEVEKEFLEKLRDLKEQLRKLKEDGSEKAKEILERITETAKEYLKTIFDKLGKNKRAADDKVERALAELNLRDILLKIRDHIKNNVDPELLKEKVEKLFGQGSELLKQFLQLIKEKATRKLLILIDQLLDEDDDDESDRTAHGISDYWEKVKDYFKDLKIDLQEKYMKFGDWVKNNWTKGKEHSKDKYENIKAIAIEFAKHAKGISKEVANEAGEFFEQYKKELGNIWDEIKERIQEIRNRKD